MDLSVNSPSGRRDRSRLGKTGRLPLQPTSFNHGALLYRAYANISRGLSSRQAKEFNYALIKIRRLLDYNPQTKIADGIPKFVEWFLKAR